MACVQDKHRAMQKECGVNQPGAQQCSTIEKIAKGMGVGTTEKMVDRDGVFCVECFSFFAGAYEKSRTTPDIEGWWRGSGGQNFKKSSRFCAQPASSAP